MVKGEQPVMKRINQGTDVCQKKERKFAAFSPLNCPPYRVSFSQVSPVWQELVDCYGQSFLDIQQSRNP
jgi:hypothetical protein